MDTSTHRLNKAITGSKVDQRVQYWKSFDDHIKRLMDEIQAERDEITECQENIHNLEAAVKDVMAQRAAFSEDSYKPSYTFTESYYNEHKDFCDKALKHIKAHELQWHRDLPGHFYCSESAFRPTSNAPIPHYEFLGAGSDPLRVKYIMCMDCYRDAMMKARTIDHYLMNLEEESNGGC